MEKEIKITPPEGFEIDKENSTFDCIKFKPIVKRFRDGYKEVHGYKLDNSCSGITSIDDVVTANDHVVFYNYKQAKSAKAMAIISQIMANDERFGGIITDEEWKLNTITKYTIGRGDGKISKGCHNFLYSFLAFHTYEQRELFLKENEDLVKEYLML